MTRRAPDWERRLSVFLTDHLEVRFQWGRLDCCLWAATWVEQCCGWDPAADLRGTYESEAGALRIIEAEGGVVAMLNRRLNRPPMLTSSFARRGDVAALPGTAGLELCIGIVLGATVAVLTPLGLYRGPLGDATHAWRVG
jgi:hypothetical protein